MAIEKNVNIPIWLNTACDPTVPLTEVVAKAHSIGYQGLEVMAFLEEGGDRAGEKDFAASHISARSMDPKKAKEILTLFNDNKMKLTLGVYHNMLTDDASQAKANLDQLVKVINTAYMMGGRANGISVGTFAGMDFNLDLDGNVKKFKDVFSPIFAYADSLGVDVSFENCQMEGWMQKGQRDSLCNLAATRQLRAMMVDAVKASNIKFIVDPSHDLCQGIPASEVVEGLKYETPERTRALHIKDTDTNFPAAAEIRAMRGGFAQPASKRAHEWDIYGAMPTLIGFAGGGDLDWTEYIRAGVRLLQNADGTYKPVIVENEDVWSKQTGNRPATWQANQAVYLNLAPLCYQLTDKGYQYDYSKDAPMKIVEVKTDKLADSYAKVK